MTFGEKLTRLRKREGLSQEALAERLGVSRQAVSRWEQNTALPDAAKRRPRGQRHLPPMEIGPGTSPAASSPARGLWAWGLWGS